MIYTKVNDVYIAYRDDCNIRCWLQWISLTIAILYLRFSLNKIFDSLRADMIVNFVQSTTYLDLSISSCDTALSPRKAK